VSARKNPALPSFPKMDPHEEKLSQMHSALHNLGDKIRKPFSGSGDKLLPKALRSAEPKEAKMARKFIDNMHKSMKGGK